MLTAHILHSSRLLYTFWRYGCRGNAQRRPCETSPPSRLYSNARLLLAWPDGKREHCVFRFNAAHTTQCLISTPAVPPPPHPTPPHKRSNFCAKSGVFKIVPAFGASNRWWWSETSRRNEYLEIQCDFSKKLYNWIMAKSFLGKGWIIPESSPRKCIFKCVFEDLVCICRHHNHSNSKWTSFL